MNTTADAHQSTSAYEVTAALHQIQQAVNSLDTEGKTLVVGIEAAPDKALPAIEAALKRRKQRSKEPELRKQLLEAYKGQQLQHCFEFRYVDAWSGEDYGDTPAMANYGLVSDTVLVLEDFSPIQVLIHEDTDPVDAIKYLHEVITEIEQGTMSARSWDDFYAPCTHSFF